MTSRGGSTPHRTRRGAHHNDPPFIPASSRGGGRLCAARASSRAHPNQIKNIVTFGDSYSDIVLAGDGGTAWPLYVARYADLTLYPFARAGATCSNNLTFRPFPSIFESQLPLYFTEKQNGTLELNPEETVYTLWIGTNDVGVNSIITGSQTPGVTVVNTTECAINWVKTLYQSGARNFIFQNMIPLQHTILYSADSYPNHYWTAPRNTTEWSVYMTELVNSGNALSKLMLQNLAPTLHGSHLGLFDSYGLFSDILSNPQDFLNGTAPLNVTAPYSRASSNFMWFDELHPSEQTDRVLARQLANGIRRESSPWLTWLT
ncbi:hypothetical protein A0H81_14748 [Grifola frondosa]|uniref:Carbohydrate esterase family 16 protein n=1 Tax=Grifola frondosa TaxID=5627 RepID=A0A1C7LL81_GRIFR|nr:hypothetical protein A0H81_14748 [Grifola frondosa]